MVSIINNVDIRAHVLLGVQYARAGLEPDISQIVFDWSSFVCVQSIKGDEVEVYRGDFVPKKSIHQN